MVSFVTLRGPASTGVEERNAPRQPLRRLIRAAVGFERVGNVIPMYCTAPVCQSVFNDGVRHKESFYLFEPTDMLQPGYERHCVPSHQQQHSQSSRPDRMRLLV